MAKYFHIKQATDGIVGNMTATSSVTTTGADTKTGTRRLQPGHDVVIVGAGIAGSTLATLLARAGFRVALIERHHRPDAYKVLCTHCIQPRAVGTLRRLGLDTLIEAAGGQRCQGRFWTRWGWIAPNLSNLYGYNLRRERLDPLVRSMAAETPGVAYMTGQKAVGLLEDDGRVKGVRLRADGGAEHAVCGTVTVGADGAQSAIAALAHTPKTVHPNSRSMYFAYYSGVKGVEPGDSKVWLMEPDIGYALPNDAGLTLLACMPTRGRSAPFRADRAKALLEFQRRLPEGPDLSEARRESKVIVTNEYPLISRPANPRPNVALVGDAAITADPAWAVGCGWAFVAAEWLAKALISAAGEGQPLATAIPGYASRVATTFGDHQQRMADFATGRAFTVLERWMFSAAARDTELATLVSGCLSCNIPPGQMTVPKALLRASWVNSRHLLRASVSEGLAGRA